jgi:hypothetical protein
MALKVMMKVQVLVKLQSDAYITYSQAQKSLDTTHGKILTCFGESLKGGFSWSFSACFMILKRGMQCRQLTM